MSRRRRQLNPWVVNSDLMTCILGIFLLISSLLIIVPHVPKKTHDGIKPKADYLVILTWDDRRNVDLDLWLKHGPCVVYYRNRECPNISLDRDSRGFLSNRSFLADGKVELSPNQEIIAIRAVLPGQFIAAVSYYEDDESGGDHSIDAKVELVKLNPTVQIISQTELHLHQVRETDNAIAFHIDGNGFIAVDPLPPDSMIAQYEQAQP